MTVRKNVEESLEVFFAKITESINDEFNKQ